jgi:hypothetical protein
MRRNGHLIALFLLSACGPDDSASGRLVLERDPCLGICPSYRLAIGSDGRVEYEGVGYLNPLGRATQRPAFRRDSTRLTPGDVAALMAAFDRARSTWWPNRYRPGRLTCPGAGTDSPTLTIVREQSSRADTLELYYGCPYGPARIHRLGTHIDSVVGVERWLGPIPSR